MTFTPQRERGRMCPIVTDAINHAQPSRGGRRPSSLSFGDNLRPHWAACGIFKNNNVRPDIKQPGAFGKQSIRRSAAEPLTNVRWRLSPSPLPAQVSHHSAHLCPYLCERMQSVCVALCGGLMSAVVLVYAFSLSLSLSGGS